MSSAKEPRPPVGPIASILANLRRAPQRVRRGSQEVIENAVSQLFDVAVRAPHAEVAAASGEYRIDDLARLAGSTTRNVRVYRDRRATFGALAYACHRPTGRATQVTGVSRDRRSQSSSSSVGGTPRPTNART